MTSNPRHRGASNTEVRCWGSLPIPLGGGQELERWASQYGSRYWGSDWRDEDSETTRYPGWGKPKLSCILSYVRSREVTRVLQGVVGECGLTFDRRCVLWVEV